MRNRLRIPALIIVATAATVGSAYAGSLFTALGGKPGTVAIANGTIDRAVGDPRIATIFKDVDLKHLKMELGVQLCQVAGGPCQYTGLSMHDAHLGYGIRTSDFNALVEDMENTMSARGIPWHVQTKLLARLAPMEPDVVSR